MRRIQSTLGILALLAGCAEGGGNSPMCGLALLTGPLVAMEGMARGDALSTVPNQLPPRMQARFVGGPLAEVQMSRDSSGLLTARLSGEIPQNSNAGFGLLVVSRSNDPLGVLIQDGAPVPGAPELGNISVGNQVLPILGVRVTPSAIETPECKLFGDG